MIKSKIVVSALLILTIGCSLKSRDKSSESQAMLGNSDEFEFAVDNVDDVLSENTESKAETFDFSNVNSEPSSSVVQKDEFLDDVGAMPTEPSFSEFKVAEQKSKVQEVVIDTPIAPLAIEADRPVEVTETMPDMELDSSFEQYQVQSGDTLMMIGFKLFGDYRKWKELKEWNRLSSMQLKTGMILKYLAPSNKSFVWRPNGEPHLVKKGEYLGSISYDKYGTSKRWKEIFDNNRPFLRDPNLIFAGFTIYYVPEKRSVASEK